MNELLYIFNTGFYVEMASKGTICLKSRFKEHLFNLEIYYLFLFMSIGSTSFFSFMCRYLVSFSFFTTWHIIIFNCFSLHHQQTPWQA